MKTKQHLLTNTATLSLARTRPCTYSSAHRRGSSQPLSALHQRELHLFQAGFSSSGPRRLSSIQLLLIHILCFALTLSFPFSEHGRIGYLKYYGRKASLCAILFCVTKVTLQGQGVSWLCWAKPLETLSFQCVFGNSAACRQTFTKSITVCLLQLVHICHRDYVSVRMRGEREWWVTVAAWGESAFCSRRVSIQTQPNCWELQHGSNLRPQTDMPWVCTEENPVVCRWMEWQWHSNSNRRRNILHFLVLVDQMWPIFEVE